MQQRLLVLSEQIVAPIDQRAQRLVAWLCGAISARQQSEAVVEPCCQLLDRHDTHARRGQLDGQWHTVKTVTHLSDCEGIVRSEGEVRLCRCCPFDEQLHCFGFAKVLERGRRV